MSKQDWSAADALAVAVLRKRNGVAPLRAFIEDGLTEYQVAAMYRRGVLLRPRNGWYADPALPPDAIRAIRVGGVLGGVSAATSWGLPVPKNLPPLLDVSLTDNAARLRHSRDKTWQVRAAEEEGVRWIWRERIFPVLGYRVSLADTLLQLAVLVPVGWLLAAMDAALHAARGEFPLIDPEAWEALGDALPERLRRTWRLADGRSESPIESLLRLALIDAGIPFDPQVWIVPCYRVDFLIGDWLVIEADGMSKYRDPKQIESDRERDAQLAAWGYHVLRFSYDQIVRDLPWVIAVIREVTARRAA